MTDTFPHIDRDELLKQISGTIGKQKVLSLSAILYKQRFEVRDLIGLTFHPEKEIAFRASWILENLLLSDPLRFVNDLGYLIHQFFNVKNKSCLRHYVKILMHLTDAKINHLIKTQIAAVDMEPVAERCFDLLIDAQMPVAVKVFCCQVLFNLRLQYEWITEMLTEQINILMDGGKPAIQSKGRALLSYLSAAD